MTPQAIAAHYFQSGTLRSALERDITAAIAAAEAAAYARAADEIERIGREQPDARDEAFLLGISFVIRDLAKQK